MPDDGDAFASTGDASEFEVLTMVLENGPYGPMMCLTGALMTLPPKGGDTPISNWDWTLAPNVSERSGTRWSDGVVVTGRLKGLAFTQTRPPRRPTSEDQARLQDRWTARTHAFTVPCSPPPGGWPVEPANVHDDIDVTAMMDAFRAYATCQPDFAGWYPGRSGSPNDSARPTALGTRTTSEPGQLVMVAAFTGDLNRHRAELRKIWPGALCVTAARRTNADRRTIDRAVHELFASRRFDPVKLLNTAPSPLGDTVLAHVTVGTAELRAELDQRFGTGAVELIAKLRPVAD